jgi:aspartyl-tRNA(Asn)/glutamyl-tRNA(Gln) amidotransferase subunit A
MKAPDLDPCDLTLIEAASALRARQFSAEELVGSIFERMAVTEPLIHAYAQPLEDQARQAARECDRDLAEGRTRGPLHGIPLAIKDIYDVAGVPTRCGSDARADAPPAERDAPSVGRLREAGAIVVGKSVTQEFAAGVVSPPARNPWNPGRIPGGSSGGTAAAISAGSAIAGMGSDTGGSIRIPATVCGVVGLKPTYGTVSVEGIYPLSWSLDTAGPLARTVDDAIMMYRMLRTGDHRRPRPSGRAHLRLGIPRPHFFDRLQDDVAETIESIIDRLRRHGIEVVDAPWDEAGVARACSFIINRVETSAVHVRHLPSHGDRYGDELRRRIEANALFPATGYVKAMQARTVIKRSVARLFEEHDLDALLTPTAPGTAAPAEHTFVQYADGTEEHVSLAYTRLTMPFNVTGQPALSIPCSFDRDDLPIGLQVAGRPYGEEALCAIGKQIEEIVDMGRRLPPSVGNLPRYQPATTASRAEGTVS